MSKIWGDMSFRKNAPGESLASIRQMSKYDGQLYMFKYRSRGPIRRRRRRKDEFPLLLLAIRKGVRVWKAKNNRSYIYGFNLNYLPPFERQDTLERLKVIFEENPGIEFSYSTIRQHLNLPSDKEDTIFRKYDVRGGKLQHLKQVNLDKYMDYLDNAINMKSSDKFRE
jgi:hypothetical protein